MPCYRCGTRQVDPDRGVSPWRRGVRADRQVLICPGCQSAGEWTADLDRCPVCASVHLVRRLGEVECRDCGGVCDSAVPAESPVTVGSPAVGSPAVGSPAVGSSAVGSLGGGLEAGDTGAPGLAEEVEQALARVLRRPVRPGSPAGIG